VAVVDDHTGAAAGSAASFSRRSQVLDRLYQHLAAVPPLDTDELRVRAVQDLLQRERLSRASVHFVHHDVFHELLGASPSVGDPLPRLLEAGSVRELLGIPLGDELVRREGNTPGNPPQGRPLILFPICPPWLISIRREPARLDEVRAVPPASMTFFEEGGEPERDESCLTTRGVGWRKEDAMLALS
jgi:hypothetical protein